MSKIEEYPEELRYAAESFLRMATKHKFMFVGMLLSSDSNSSLRMVIRNTDDSVSNLGEVFRLLGDIVEVSEVQNHVVTPLA